MSWDYTEISILMVVANGCAIKQTHTHTWFDNWNLQCNEFSANETEKRGSLWFYICSWHTYTYTRTQTHTHISVTAWPIKYLVRIPAPMLNIHLFSKMNKGWAIDAFIWTRICMSVSCVCVCVHMRIRWITGWVHNFAHCSLSVDRLQTTASLGSD